MKKVAISACLLGCSCRYDANHNFNEALLELLKPYETIPFCPEDYCFGTPRPTMDLIKKENKVLAISNKNHENLSNQIETYAKDFFDKHEEIDLFIGKDRSPSCAVESGKLYDKEKNLLFKNATGLMSEVALDFGIECWDAEIYVANHTS